MAQPFIKINGLVCPYPKRGLSLMTATLVDAARNANGTTVGQKIGRDRYKLDGLVWSAPVRFPMERNSQAVCGRILRYRDLPGYGEQHYADAENVPRRSDSGTLLGGQEYRASYALHQLQGQHH